MKTQQQQQQPKYFADLQKPRRIKDGVMSIGIYNLIVSIRDLKIYSRGIKPHRNWRITDVKKYFGVQGSTLNILSKLELELEMYKYNKENFEKTNK